MSLLSRLFGRPTMDVLILGVPRSGTSMLGNLMSSPPEQLILYEPHLGRRKPSRYAADQMAELGLPAFRSTRALARYVDAHTGRWGVKEVMARHLRPTLRLYEIGRVVFVVRDIRHAAMSIFDRVREIPHRFSPGWRGQGIVETAGLVVDLHARMASERKTVVRYERFVTDETYRREVEEELSWPLRGDPTRGLRQQGRARELERHEQRVTARSLELRETEDDPEKLAFADELVAQCTAYQELFGYES